MKAVFLDFATLGPGDIDIAVLERVLPEIELHATTAPAQAAAHLGDAEVAIVNKVRLDRDVLEAKPQLRLICLAATGTDNIDLEAATTSGVAVCNIRDYCTPSVVQHVFALILTLTQHLDTYRTRVRRGDWERSDTFCLLEPPLRELAGKTLGIVGYGTLGRGVAAAARGFGMEVIAARRPYRGTLRNEYRDAGDVERVAFTRLLETADVISLHCPLTAETERLIDTAALSVMREDALLINTARGGLVDVPALLSALAGGGIGGAAIDVLEQEPPARGHALLEADLPNLIVTPHMAWAARESRQRALNEIAANVAAFAAGEKRNRVI